MAISVQVRAFSGAVETTCTHPAIPSLCQRASRLGMPMLGFVDPYDDTVFNRSQMRLVIPELRKLADDSPADEAQAARELIRLASRIEHETHRYLLFNGD
ncbi:MAG TPA: hypothetical protein VHW44_27735 [Pseudonocardiaceae bacterium]|jgi:hypothetical protein|nr:hypothetical protein [Pseudonocardiaceae bacterium]